MKYTRQERLELFQEALKNISLGLEMFNKGIVDFEDDPSYKRMWLVWVEDDSLDKLDGEYTPFMTRLNALIDQEVEFIKQDKLNRVKKNGK